MGYIVDLTDNQWYNFICGYYAGLKLKDLTLPDYESGFVLQPISVGGSGEIGIMVPEEVVSDGIGSIVKVPISTHDVDIDYSGFSVALNFDSERLSVYSVEEGDFGTISSASSGEATVIKYAYSGGLFKASGLYEYPKVFKDPTILFYINFKVIGYITKESPVKLSFDSSNLSDINKTTLLKYAETLPGRYDLFFITPLSNDGGSILGDDEVPTPEPGDNEDSLGDIDLSVTASTPGVYLLGAYIGIGSWGLFPIVVLINKASIPGDYNKAYVEFVVHDFESCGFSLMALYDGIGLADYEASTLENGDLLVKATFKAHTFFDGIVNCGFGKVSCYESFTKRSAQMELIKAELIGDDTLEVSGSAGCLINFIPSGAGAYGLGGAGGIGGGGSIYSGSSQIIFVQCDSGVSFPIHLEPGWNDVHFFIPHLYPEDVFIDAPIKIISDGYILIPAGFGWESFPDPNAPPVPPNQKMFDGLKIIDTYKIEISSTPSPIDLDGLYDELEFSDFTASDIIEAKISNSEVTDELEFSDFTASDIIEAKISNSEVTDELRFIGVFDTYNIDATLLNNDGNEGTEITDVFSIDIE